MTLTRELYFNRTTNYIVPALFFSQYIILAYMSHFDEIVKKSKPLCSLTNSTFFFFHREITTLLLVNYADC